MILKIAGASLVLASSYLAGNTLVKQIIQRKKELETIQLLFEKMKEKALNNMNDISECIIDSIGDLHFKCKNRFENLAKKLKNNQYTDFSQAWEDTKCDMTPLKSDDIVILDNFFTQTDSTALGMYIGRIEETLKKIEENLNAINESLEKNKKMYYNICICTGLLTVILLI